MAKRRKRKIIKKTIPTKTTQNSYNICGTNTRGWGFVIFLIGLIFLIKDYGGAVWWKASWYTVLLLLIGLCTMSNK